MSFNPTEAAFEGFRLARRSPKALLAWALAYVLFFAVFFLAAGPSLLTIISMAEQFEQGAQPSAEALEPMMLAYGAMIVWALPLGLLFGAVLNTAIARSVLRPEQARFGYLRVGKDELRVLVASLIVGLLTTVASVVIFGVVMVIGAQGSALGMPILWLPAALLGLAGIAGLIWLSVRLSLVLPMTFARGRVSIVEAFRLTKGRFWPLFGMAILAGVMAILVAFLGGIVAAPLDLMFGGLQRLAEVDGGIVTVLQQAWPALVVWLCVNAILGAAQVAILYAPFSVAYRDMI